MQGSISVVKTVKTKMRQYDENSYDRDRKRDKTRFKKFRKNNRDNDKRRYSFDD